MTGRTVRIPVSVLVVVAVAALLALVEGRRANNRIDRMEAEDERTSRIIVQDMIDDLEDWANNDHPSGEDW